MDAIPLVECGMFPTAHTTDPPSTAASYSAYGRFVQATHFIQLAATSNPGDTAPPGIFLRLFIFGGLAFVVLVAWFVLRGYRDSGDQSDKNPK
jgi:hypothetical protein